MSWKKGLSDETIELVVKEKAEFKLKEKDKKRAASIKQGKRYRKCPECKNAPGIYDECPKEKELTGATKKCWCCDNCRKNCADDV